MYCFKCGHKNPDEAKFCQNCGTKLDNESQKSKIDANEVFDKSADLIKTEASNFKDKWSTWSDKQKFLSLIVCCCIGWILISSIMGALTPDKNAEIYDQSNEGRNISLIKESTSGYAFYSDDKPVYQYDLTGVLKNIPEDQDGFTVRGTFYDDDHSVIKKDERDLDYFSYSTENSDPTTIASIQTNDFFNVSEIQITIMNPDGDVVFDEKFDYDMDEFDLSGLDDKPEAEEDNESEDLDFDSDLDTDDGSSTVSSLTDEDYEDDSSSSSSSSSSGTYVASANSDKFHYPSCSHAHRIKDSNKITYSSREDAVASGRSPCAVCSP